MKEVKLPNRTIKDSEDKEERPKTLHDYTSEELDILAEHDPEYESQLWSDAETEAINDPENHEKST